VVSGRSGEGEYGSVFVVDPYISRKHNRKWYGFNFIFGGAWIDGIVEVQ
jgi:hypothetical protein